MTEVTVCGVLEVSNVHAGVLVIRGAVEPAGPMACWDAMEDSASTNAFRRAVLKAAAPGTCVVEGTPWEPNGTRMVTVMLAAGEPADTAGGPAKHSRGNID